MDIKEILAKVDHTVLGQTATWADIKGLCDDGMKYETASVCIPPSYVKQAAEYIKSVNGKLKVCTVIGFPNGYNTTAVKCYETRTAVEEGADEIDMVINIGWVKDGLYDNLACIAKRCKEYPSVLKYTSERLLCGYNVYLCLAAWSNIHGGSCISYSSYSLLDCLNGILLNREAELFLIYWPVGNHNRLLLVLKVAENLLCYERHIWMEKL